MSLLAVTLSETPIVEISCGLMLALFLLSSLGLLHRLLYGLLLYGFPLGDFLLGRLLLGDLSLHLSLGHFLLRCLLDSFLSFLSHRLGLLSKSDDHNLREYCHTFFGRVNNFSQFSYEHTVGIFHRNDALYVSNDSSYLNRTRGCLPGSASHDERFRLTHPLQRRVLQGLSAPIVTRRSARLELRQSRTPSGGHWGNFTGDRRALNARRLEKPVLSNRRF